MTTAPTPLPQLLNLKPYVGGDSIIAGHEQVLKLASNESAYGASPQAVAAYQQAAGQLLRYPDGECKELRQAIAESHNLQMENIVCGAGSDELISLLINCYCGQGDEVLYSEYGFLMYKIYALGCGAVPVAAAEENLTANVDNLLAKVTAKTKLLFIANPNNPTGSLLPAEEIKRLHSQLPAHVMLVIDGAYAEYLQPADYEYVAQLVEQHENVVMLRTFSKIYALSGLRVGWGYAPTAVVDIINRRRSPFNVNAVAQATAAAAVRDQQHIAKVREQNQKQREYLQQQFTAIGLHVYPSAGNFLLVAFPQGAEQANAADNYLRQQYGIILRPTANYGLPECLRITVSTAEENQRLVIAMQAFMEQAVAA
jgi:histidinol-phosphate aminotransferase